MSARHSCSASPRSRRLSGALRDDNKASPLIAPAAARVGPAVAGPVVASPAQGLRLEPVTPGVVVTGVGEVRGRPDTLSVSLGVSVTRKTVSEATTEAASLADKLLATLKDNGVAADDVQTRDYSISPPYAPQPTDGTAPRINGYTVSNIVQVTVRDVSKAGKLIDPAAAAGGNDVVVQGVWFSLEDNAAFLKQAREHAWQDAKAKATELAGLAGVTLGAAVQISETTTGGGAPAMGGARSADAAATPIVPGTVTTSVVLTVWFGLES